MRKRARSARRESEVVSVGEKRSESLGLAFTARIKRDKQRLRRCIADDPQLTRDFDLLIGKTGWHSEFLLARLFWDKNIMHADPRAVLAQMKREDWPIAMEDLEKIVKGAHALAEQIERVNETDFSPARTLILRDKFGERLRPRKERELQDSFASLPEILRIYAGELRRKVLITAGYSRRNAEDRATMVKDMRKTSLFELVRSATGQYHATRLLRLVNAARKVCDLPAIEQRAFIVWLNRLRKRHSAGAGASPLVTS